MEEPVFVQLGPQKWKLGGEYLKELESCNQCLDADNIGEALRQQLDEKGYIYLKRVLPENDVLKARTAGRSKDEIIESVEQTLFDNSFEIFTTTSGYG